MIVLIYYFPQLVLTYSLWYLVVLSTFLNQQWMAIDFKQERRWKQAQAKHIAEYCVTQFVSKPSGEEEKRDLEEAKMQARKMAGWMREVWRNSMDIVEPMQVPILPESDQSKPVEVSMDLAVAGPSPVLADEAAVTSIEPMHISPDAPTVPPVEPTPIPDGTDLSQQLKICYDKVSNAINGPIESKHNESLHDFQRDALAILQTLTAQGVGKLYRLPIVLQWLLAMRIHAICDSHVC